MGMNILHTVEFYAPSIGGMQEVVRQISERLVKLGHKVTVATTRLPERVSTDIKGVEIVEFDISGNEVRGYRGDTESYSRFLLNGKFDVVSNFAAQQWATDLMFPVMEQISAKKVFVPTGFSGLYWPQYRGYFQKMPEIMRRYDRNVFLSENYRDIDFARRHGIGNGVVIPNGAGADEFLPKPKLNVRAKYGIADDDFLVLLVGSHTGLKGHAEAIRIFTGSRIRNATLIIVANAPGGGCTRRCRIKASVFDWWRNVSQSSKRILIEEMTREETVAAYHEADLFLFPSNIECSPIVLYECMASKTPFLVTDVGNAAEIIRWSGGGRLLPTRTTKTGFSKARIGGSVALLNELWRDSTSRGSMAEAGFLAWKERFTWEKIAAGYENLYLSLLQEDC